MSWRRQDEDDCQKELGVGGRNQSNVKLKEVGKEIKIKGLTGEL